MSLIYRKSKSNRRERDGTNNHTGKLNLGSDLSVDGKISIISETSTPSQPSDGTGHIYSKSDGKIYWRSFDVAETELGGGGSTWTTSSSNIYRSSGNVGIGTTSPTSLLEISKAATNSQSTGTEMLRLSLTDASDDFANPNQAAGSGTLINFTNQKNSTNGSTIYHMASIQGLKDTNNDNIAAGRLVFSTNTNTDINSSAGTSTEALRINSLSNLGINDTNPISKLQIRIDGAINDADAQDSGKFDDYNLCLRKEAGTDTGSEIGLCFYISGNGYDPTNENTPGAAITHERTGLWSKGKLHFKTKISTSNTGDCVTAMTINDDSNVGIGDTSPISKLSVAGKISITSESTTPDAPADGKGYLYSKAGGGLFWRSYDINETALIENDGQFSFHATNGGDGYHFNGGTSNTYYQFPNSDSDDIDFTFIIGIVKNSSQFFDVDTCEYTVPMDGNYTFGWTTSKLGHSSGSRLVIRRLRGSTYTDLVDSGYSTTSSVRYTSVSNTSLLRNDIVSFWVLGPNSVSGGEETGLHIMKATSFSTSAYTIIHGYKN